MSTQSWEVFSNLKGPEDPRKLWQREAAWQRFASLGIPTTRDEDWKYVGLRHLSDQPERFSQSPDLSAPSEQGWSETIKAPTGITPDSMLVFIDGQFCPALSWGRLSSSQLTVQPLSHLNKNALIEGFADSFDDGVLDRARLSEELAIEGHGGSARDKAGAASDHRAFSRGAFHWLARARFQDGCFIRIDHQHDKPHHICLQYLSSRGRSQDPTRHCDLYQNFVSIGPRAQAVIYEQHGALDEANSGPAISHNLMRIRVGAGAKLTHLKSQMGGSSSDHLAEVEVWQDQDSTYQSFNLALGGRVGRHSAEVLHDGPGAHTHLDGLSLAGRGVERHQRTAIFHHHPHGTSDQFFKGLFMGGSRNSFLGLVHVAQDAQKIAASQLNKNLLLEEGAQVHTRPQLLIDADDVKCSHGATVSRLRDEELFYLMSRALPRQKAQDILARAFAAELFCRIPEPSYRPTLNSQLDAYLEQTAATPEASDD